MIGMKVYYYDIENKLSLGNAIQVPNPWNCSTCLTSSACTYRKPPPPRISSVQSNFA